MKKTFFLIVAVALFLFACSESADNHHDETVAETSETAEKMVYPADSVSPNGLVSFHGLRINEDGVMPVMKVSEIMPAGSADQMVKLEGTIEACCQAKGCWMTVKLPNEESMRITFKDYGFFVPKDAAGKTAIFEGRIAYDTTSVETLRHYAVDGGMTEEAAAEKYTEPKVELSFEATGVMIKG
ncbi:MAG: DUF4920 domain-containing protein [Bacteroidia bacterium]|nr:DUF4920 domain-containing protein [Bacteroidia bacterium]